MSNNTVPASDRIKYIRELNSRTKGLNLDRIKECKDTVRESYETATLVHHIADPIPSKKANCAGLVSIGIRRLIDLKQFNDPSYYWTAYFSQVGRVVASGERRYFQKQIRRHIKAEPDTISRSSPDFSLLEKSIVQLKRRNLEPDTLLAPISLYVPFWKSYKSRIEWRAGQAPNLHIERAGLNLFWSHKYAQLRSFIILSSKAGVWHFSPDPNSGSNLTIALGKSLEKPGFVEYWVETLAQFVITDKRSFSRIILHGKQNKSGD